MSHSTFGFMVVGLLCTAFVPIALADDAKDDAIKKDHKLIEGTWRIIALEVNGNKSKEADARKLTVVNGSDGTWILYSEDKEVTRGTSTTDPSKKPKAIDFMATEGNDKDKKHPGIYELGEKTRKLCFAAPGKERPTEFSSPADSGIILVVFEREKQKQEKGD